MKQTFRHYLAWVLMVLVWMTVPVLPHHHHGGEACFVVEVCQSDHTPNDLHTHHHGDLSTCKDYGHSLCVPSKRQETRVCPDHPVGHEALPLTGLSFAPSFLFVPKLAHKPYACLLPDYRRRSRSLRAPPARA